MKHLFFHASALVLSAVLLSCESDDRTRVTDIIIERPAPAPHEVVLNTALDASILVSSDTLKVSLSAKSDTLLHTLLMVDADQIGYTTTYPYYVEKVLPKGDHRLQIATSSEEVSSVVDGNNITFTATAVTDVCFFTFKVK